MNQTEMLNALFAEEWEFRLHEDPILATRSGDSRYNDRLPALTEADFERRAAAMHSFLERLHAIDPQTLPADAALNYALFERTLQNTLTEYGFQLYRMPITKLSGPHTDLPDLLEVTPFDSLADYEAYLARLQAIGLYLSQHIDLLRNGMKTGLVPALVAMQGIEDGADGASPRRPNRQPLL